MSEMVERVALALYGSSGPKTPNHTWDDCIQQAPMLADCYRDHARAVIAAMREPTEAMVIGTYGTADFDFDGPREIYRTMIDEALK